MSLFIKRILSKPSSNRVPIYSFMRRNYSSSSAAIPVGVASNKNEDNGRGSSSSSMVMGVVGTALGAFLGYSFNRLRRQGGEINGLSSSVLHAASQIPPPPKGGGSRRERFNFIAEVVDETAKCLVFIEIKDMGVRDFYTGQPMTNSNGSGFIVKSDGLILTNAHVVINKPRASVQVRLQDGRTFNGVVEDVDVKSDLATVRIPIKGLPTMNLGNSSSVRPGEFVVALGSPLSLSNTITTGVVSSVSRQKSELGLRGRDVPEYIQTDAAITFGNSGGPLINLDGEAIGINSMKVTPGISFAIPIDYAKDFLRRSEKSSNSSLNKRRYIGITMLTLTPQIIDELQGRMEIPSKVTHGIVVFKMISGSPSDKGGMLPGDIITHINGTPIHGSSDVYKILESNIPELYLNVLRKGRFIQIKIQPEN